MPCLEWGLQAVTMQQEAPAETRSPQREAGITGEERSGNTHQKVTPRRCGSGAFLCAPGFPGTGNGADLSILQWAQKGGDEGLHLGVVRCPLPEPAGPSRPPCPTPPKMSCRGGRQSVQAPVFGLKCQTDRPEPVAPPDDTGSPATLIPQNAPLAETVQRRQYAPGPFFASRVTQRVRADHV